MLAVNNFCSKLPDNENAGYRYTEDEILNAVATIQKNNKGRDTEIAMSRLIKQFYPYIAKSAMAIDSANVDDKIIAGCEGLLHAARKYDLANGASFFTYAYTCISGYMKWDFRHSRLIKLTSTMLKRLRKPENEAEFNRLSNPLSLNAGIGNSGDSEEDDHEMFLSDGVDYEDNALSDVYNKSASEIMKKIIMEDDEEACPGVTYGEIFCHVYELFGYTYMPIYDIAAYYGIDESNVRKRCDIMQKRIRSNWQLKKYLGYKTPWWGDFGCSPDEYAFVENPDEKDQFYLNLQNNSSYEEFKKSLDNEKSASYMESLTGKIEKPVSEEEEDTQMFFNFG